MSPLEKRVDNPYMETFWNSHELKYMADKSYRASYTHPFDGVLKYRGNNYGYRDEDFTGNADIVFSGCSFTYGVGIEEKYRWGNLIGEKLSMSTACLGVAGASVTMIIDELFAYFKEFGNPKILLCLFPDPHRYVIPIDGEVLSGGDIGLLGGEASINGVRKYLGILQTKGNRDINNEIKHLKKPFESDVVITPDIALRESIRSIRHLEQYCLAAGIKFVWSTWSDDLLRAMDDEIQTRADLKFDSYVSAAQYGGYAYFKHVKKNPSSSRYALFSDRSAFVDCNDRHMEKDCECDLSCHHLEEEWFEHSGQFHHGLDVLENYKTTHPGIHFNLHIAETFLPAL